MPKPLTTPTGSASLSEYDRKRNFAQTPEPGPDAAALASTSPRFMVHKHHARRLHYDLRLEIDGALGSWAVPRGPSFDPEVKRLAVQTEDHPLAYGDFEGRIPDGLYGAGESLVWDRGQFDTVPPGQVAAMRKKGHVHFALFGEKLRGEWHLLRTTSPDGRRVGQNDPKGSGPKSQWLLVKVKDAFADPALDIVTARPESVLTGQSETRGPQPVGRAGAEGTQKPSMPILLATGVLGSEPSAEVAAKKSTRIPTPLFAAVPLKSLHIDVSRPQDLLDLPGHLFGEAEPVSTGNEAKAVSTGNRSAGSAGFDRSAATAADSAPTTSAAQGAELLFVLEKNEGAARDKTLGAVAEVAHVLHDFLAALALDALVCVAGKRALLVRVSIAPAPGNSAAALSTFAEKIAETLSSQVALLQEKRVQLRIESPDHAPVLLEKLPGEPKLICAPLAWGEVDSRLSVERFKPAWLKAHRETAEELIAAHRAAAAPLPRAR